MNTSHLKIGKFKFSNQMDQTWIPILLILVLGIGLRLYQIGTESIWIDENFSIRDAENLRLGTRPLYYLVLRFWMFFGTSDTWLRLLSFPFSVGCIVLTYLLGLKISSRFVALVAAFLMAVSPLFVGYAQEIRMYSMSTFLTLWGTLALVGILENDIQSLRSWIMARGLAILTTPLNLLLLIADLMLLGWKFQNQRHQFRKLGKGLLLIGLFWLPFAYVLWKVGPKFMEGWVANKPKPDVLLIPSILTVFTTFWPISDLPKSEELNFFNVTAWGWKEPFMLLYMGYTLMAVFVFAIGLLQLKNEFKQNPNSPKLLWVALWALLPSLLIIIISYNGGSIWRDRYLMFVAPYYLLLLAVGFQQIWRNYRVVALVMAAVYFLAVGGGLFHYYTKTYHDDWKGVAQLIEANEKPGDVIGFYAVQWEPHLALPRYYKGSASFHVLGLDKLPRDPEQTPIAVSKMLDTLPPTKSRYWIVIYDPWSGGVLTFQSLINQRYNVLLTKNFPNSVNDDEYVFLVQPRQ